MFTNFSFDKTSNQISFNISNLSLAIINGIRRVLISDIPIIGFAGEGDELSIDIFSNNTPLNNEIIQNRISMIPIFLDENETDNFKNENGIQELKISLNYTSKDIIENVTTRDLEVLIDNKKVNTSKYFPPNHITKQHILITKLKRNEHLHLQAFALTKTARFHTSFSPVSGCCFHPVFSNKHDNPNDNERDFEKNEIDEPINVIFKFDVINKLSHKYLFQKAILILIDKLHLFNNNLDNDIIQIIKHKQFSFDFNIPNENDTFGNIIQSYIYDTYVKTKKTIFNDKLCTFAGYINVHPLQNILKLRLSIQDLDDVKDFKTFLGIISQEIITYLNIILDEWNKSYSI